MKMITLLLLFFSLQAVAGGPFWQGKVENFSINKIDNIESLFTATIDGAKIETNSSLVAKIILTAKTLDIEVRVFNYRLDVRDISKTGILVGAARIEMIDTPTDAISSIKVITNCDSEKTITREELHLIVDEKKLTINPTVIERDIIMTKFGLGLPYKN